ncbi:protein translocase subunit secF [Psychromonas ingrahamii 37]|uniref:Protein-export membrane protein SecF n=1 Tax=Psychromonas ingrahamii (strain DSM 17664 / CCUG 51855 / 37) TaxID=357804 RepID=A1SWT7_PSYIN|nr:protein translocase subunit SecF [Psychromonas ingrahamii]ABM03952.1 protein translocase subunit secF [Psychromonas ingrahamii 37]
MFELIKSKKTLPFMQYSKPASWFSMFLIVASVAALSINWLNWGLDFTGGTVIEVGFEQPAVLPDVRDVLASNDFSDAVVQHFGTSRDVMIRLAPREGVRGEVIGTQVLESLQNADFGQVDMRRIEFVGPNVGAELANSGGLAIIIALICILIYVSIRFEWRLACGSVLALAHDIIITLGFFSLFKIEVDLTVLAALLAVVGYSLNDTIVVFDRIRENFRLLTTATSNDIVDKSLTQTLSRTLITSGTTIFVLISLFIFGGALIHGFATALLIGVIVGTYSSIYVASALAIKLGISREHMIPEVVEKEGADQDPL